ncbi:bifunctional 5,10-methylenetetrahydrofolate dehydrogenase/5,10-methenyltetrahydrofolate cyclohydrolase [Isachenkonia alkalipeptolytica]|uniref:Bifunctional protein FolD n=1 Tax=Isachenkonia alkalipeptolytica TaxID=2565777 RepID=A0AA43XLN1_9CLOT|nr:tetrahydrofolate dehydrogenase/cyclohydrolase catalytic domain-containing protein [Isachenkonia alkalipeptolytica]NBG88596.1 bifunctional 5,10-methylene-tetrahydrofolate dehydrogenase/5,10-methylene-tetrahydrofolate cyclohydrolase [Isachenkonia alkalipeptolytica]
MAKIIKGKPVADKITEELSKEIENIKAKGGQPKLATLRVGERGDDIAYERGATKRAEKIGIEVASVVLPGDITQEDFIEELQKLNKDASVNGILIFRPLPKQIDESMIKNIIAPEKDIDCFSPVNVGKMTEGDPTGFNPCTPSAVMEILDFYGVEIKGAEASVIGSSMVVGKPVAMLLLNRKATVRVAHSKTRDTAAVARQGEILVVGVGVPKMVKEDWVSEGAVVIDVGINVDDEGNMSGDVDFEKVQKKASMITPVPRGVGSVTTTVLAKHVLKAYKQQN